MVVTSPGLRVLLAVIVVACLVTGVAIAMIDGDERRGARGAGPPADEGRAGDPAGSPGGKPGNGEAGQEPRPGSATAPTVASGPRTTVAADSTLPSRQPGPTSPPAPGRYRYRVTSGEESGELRVTVEARGLASGEVRQLVAVEGGTGGTVASDVVWRPSGAFVIRSRFGAYQADCDWEPDTLGLKLPLVKGGAWSVDSSCNSSTPQGGTARFRLEASFSVVDTARIAVAGEAVDVWVIKATETLTGTIGTATESSQFLTEEEETRYFSPRHGLAVRVVTAGPGGGPAASRELVSLRPE
jgi:hypothetical protein